MLTAKEKKQIEKLQAYFQKHMSECTDEEQKENYLGAAVLFNVVLEECGFKEEQ